MFGGSRRAIWYTTVIMLAVTVNLLLLYAIFTPKGHFSFNRLIPGEAVPVSAQVQRTEESNIYLQWEKVDEFMDGDFLVEEYQQFEIHKSDRGETLKVVPTDHKDYLRYYQGTEPIVIPENTDPMAF
ncbi:hypothetical protein [Marinicrinis lubricantis]|uniref:Fibronectin type-III domain-containing protein n=1 Tax=Marinicrinis lubricantis TaxID=2086470 RepID=A0ABW1IQQ7_9BACL